MKNDLEQLKVALEGISMAISIDRLQELLVTTVRLSEHYDKQINKCKRKGNHSLKEKLMDDQRVITDIYWRLKQLRDYEQLKQRLDELIVQEAILV